MPDHSSDLSPDSVRECMKREWKSSAPSPTQVGRRESHHMSTALSKGSNTNSRSNRSNIERTHASFVENGNTSFPNNRVTDHSTAHDCIAQNPSSSCGTV